MGLALVFTVGGANKSSLVVPGSLQIQDVLNHRNTASFTLIDPAGAYRPAIGATVSIVLGATTIFAGSVDQTTEQRLSDNTTGYSIEVECVDYNQLCDRFLVAQSYEVATQTLKDIVKDASNSIITTYLTADSVTGTNVATGPVIEIAQFNNKTVKECFDQLATITGYDWYIDYSKDLHFFSRATNLAPFSLTDSSGNYRDVRVEKTRDQYRNKQIVRAGFDKTTSQVEEFIGDTERTTFTLAYELAEAPTVRIDVGAGYIAQTEGIRGKDADADFNWFYAIGEKEITQSDSGTVLDANDKLEVTYIGRFPLLVSTRNEGEITARVTAEGGTGIYEAIETDESINDQALAFDMANGLLRKFVIPTIVYFETDTDGLKAGQLITITNTAHNLSGQYLIETVTARDMEPSTMRYSVKALSGESQGTWVNFFERLANAGKKFAIRENESIITGQSQADTISFTDSLTPADRAIVTPVYNTAQYGFDELVS